MRRRASRLQCGIAPSYQPEGTTLHITWRTLRTSCKATKTRRGQKLEIRGKFLYQVTLADYKIALFHVQCAIHIPLCFISESCHLFFANQIYLVQMQNVPELRINVLQTGLGNAIGVDFDKRYSTEWQNNLHVAIFLK